MLFWTDRWLGECHISALFPNLFSIASDIGLTVASVLENGQINLTFRRQLTGSYREEWVTLINELSSINLIRDKLDVLHWRWNATGRFTVHSFYTWLEYGGVKKKYFDTIWKAKIPFKIKIFLWLVKQKKVLTRVNLSKRGWQGDVACSFFCGEPETVDHLFIQRSFVKYIWDWLADFNHFSFDCSTIEDYDF